MSKKVSWIPQMLSDMEEFCEANEFLKTAELLSEAYAQFELELMAKEQSIHEQSHTAGQFH